MTLELTCLGHATLLVRSERTTLLCDPILGDAVSGGGNVVSPRRTVHIGRLPPIDAVLLSHHHSDHFSLEDLAAIPRIREHRIFAPEGSDVLDELRRFGCARVEPLSVGRGVDVGDVTVTPTPSAVDFPDVGFLFRSRDTAALNLVDTQIHGVLGRLQSILDAPVQVTLAPFQSGGYMEFLPLRVGGPPEGLVEAIARWSDQYTQDLVDDLCVLGTQHVAPFADGLMYLDQGINAWHFPLPASDFLDRMARRGVPGCPALPGTVFAASPAGVIARAQASALVTVDPRWECARTFDPIVRLTDIPLSCAKWNKALLDDGAVCWSDIRGALRHRIATNILRASPALDRQRVEHLLGWFLECCDAPAGMECLYVQRARNGFRVRVEQARPAGREYGLRLHGRDLLRIMEGRILLEHVTLGGAFRYHSPPAPDDLERIRGRVFDPLRIILGMA
jgi:L-ascorbate metabolism protein UlaG (beta-lactamase superfamily)